VKKRMKIDLSGLISLSLSAMAMEVRAADDIKQRTARVSYGTAADHPFGLGVTKFSELVAQKTAGKITVRAYAVGVLGAEAPSISSAQGGCWKWR
jgi:TRAP-type C4-dicarboxylate transport system substrate-binding protein